MFVVITWLSQTLHTGVLQYGDVNELIFDLFHTIAKGKIFNMQ